MELPIPIKEKDKTKGILRLLNPFLGDMTPKQIDIVSTMIDLDIEVLDKYSRARIKESLSMNTFVFNNIISTLKQKKILIQSTVDLRLNPNLKKYTSDDTYTIKFINA